MFQGLPDTQNESDHREIIIDRVGVRELRYPIRYRDSKGIEQPTVAKFEITVELPAHLKGTHMSRFVEVLHAFDQPLDSHSIRDLTETVAARLQSDYAYVSCEFTVFREKIAPVSGTKSLMDYELGLECHFSKANGFELFMGLEVPVTTLCPCSKAISERGAHNQRGNVTISAKAELGLTFQELINLIEKSASCELFSGLKRADEKAVTERAYDNPLFVEDLARDVATGLTANELVTWFRVEVENFESIHNHNAYAMIEA